LLQLLLLLLLLELLVMDVCLIHASDSCVHETSAIGGKKMHSRRQSRLASV
jgi:hypothetical protein